MNRTSVIALRMLKSLLAMRPAKPEARRMVDEKIQAGWICKQWH